MQQAQTDWFETWFGSPYYKVLYQHRDELEAREFVENLLKYLNPLPDSRMLDIACGEGRFAKQLAEHGFDVTGIDLSHYSIEKAQKDANDKLHFYVHDMRYPFYINYFDYAFNFFTSFGYFTQNRDNVLAAKSFAAALKKNGLLVVDYLNKDYTLQRLKPVSEIQRGDLTFHIKKQLSDGHFVKDISFVDTEKRERHFKESVAAFTLSDFIKIFKEAKLTLVGTFGDYNLNNYHPTDSPRMIMIFKK